MPIDDHGPRTTARRLLAFAIVAAAASLSFGLRLRSEPAFADEWAYVGQSYFGPLWWGGDWDDPRWFEYPAIDLPPLPKYQIAAMLRLGGRPLPTREAGLAWYDDTSTTYGDLGLLTLARWPTVLIGVLGCLAACAIAMQAYGPASGGLAGLVLAVDPLYRMHARRAMSDVPAEALTLVALAVGLWGWRAILGGRRPASGAAAIAVVGGVFAGLSVLAKLSGGLATMTLGAWALLGLLLRRFDGRRRALVVGSVALSGPLAFATFLVGNPTLIGDPRLPRNAPEPVVRLAEAGLVGRTEAIIEHRSAVSKAGQQNALFVEQGYPLTAPAEKLGVVAVQGFGRFGPLGPRRSDSLVRYDWRQDRGALLWGPLVLGGIVWSVVLGRRQLRDGAPPTAWAVLVQFGVALATVAAFIPMAWDRYMLPIQSGAAILASGFVAGALGRFRRRGWPGA